MGENIEVCCSEAASSLLHCTSFEDKNKLDIEFFELIEMITFQSNAKVLVH